MARHIDAVVNALSRNNTDFLPRGELFIGRDFLDHFFCEYRGQYTKQLGAAAQRLGLSVVGTELGAEASRPPLTLRSCGVLEDHFTIGIINGPVSRLVEEMGFLDAMLSTRKNKSLFQGIASKFLKDTEKKIKSARVNGLHAIAIADDIAGNRGPIFPLHYVVHTLMPVYGQIAEMVKAEGLYAFFHSDGDMKKVIELLIKAGYDCLHPVDTQAGAELRQLNENFGERMSFMGHIDIISWSKEQIKNEIDLSERSFKKGGLILGSTCGISMKTATEKLGWLYPSMESELTQT